MRRKRTRRKRGNTDDATSLYGSGSFLIHAKGASTRKGIAVQKTGFRTGATALFTALLVAMTFAGAPAQADDTLRERVADHEDRVQTHRRERASRELEGDLQHAVALFREAEGTADAEHVQARLIKQVGSLTKVRDDVVRIAALETLGLMGHEDCARYVKPFLKPAKDERGQKRAAAAIEAAREIADDALVLPLLRIVDRSKNYEVAARAVRALGRYGRCERYREKILKELAVTLRSDMPAAPKRGRDTQDSTIPGKQGHGGTARWRALSRVLPRALNELTGQDIASVGDWLALVREHRRDLGALFVSEDDA